MNKEIGERIVCAACKHDEVIFAGVRHFDKVMHTQIANAFREEDLPRVASEMEQGFITTKYRFVTREEAWIIAEQRGQITRQCGNPNSKVLYSEHLY